MDSLADLQQAVALHPQDRKAWLRLSAAAKAAGDLSVECDALQRLVALKPSDVSSLRRIAILTARDNTDMAIATWKAVLILTPDDLGAHEQIAVLLDSRDPAQALPHLQAIARLTPNKAKPWKRLAKRLQDLGRSEESLAAWAHCLTLSPDDLESHRRIARIHFLANRPAEGQPHLDTVLRLETEALKDAPPPALADLVPEPPPLKETPLVSAVILSLEGAELLESLFASFHAYNRYPNVELIVIDHASTDDTAAVLDRWQDRLPLRRIMRDANYSYSASCNLGVREATGDLILLLNNDVVFHEDVVTDMVRHLTPDVGIVGLKQYDSPPLPEALLRPYHIGVRFIWNEAKQWLQPRHLVPGPADRALATGAALMPAVTASVMLCRKAGYEAVGGLDEGYWYGLEDIDFCLKMRLDQGRDVVSVNSRSVFHVKSTTRRAKGLVGEAKTNAANEALFWGRWRARLKT